MSLLNTASEGLPNNLVVIFRWLFQNGSMPKEDLMADCDPGPYAGGGGGSTNKRNTDTFNHWTKNGLLKEENGEASINWEICRPWIDKKSDVELAVSRLPHIARSVVFHKDNNKNFFSSTGTNDGDLTRAVSWFLGQDVYEISAYTIEQLETLEAQQMPSLEREESIIKSNVRYNGFKYWARYLGFLTYIDRRTFLVDPTVAVRETLGEVFGSESELDVRKVLSGLSKHLPVLDGGHYRKLVEKGLDRKYWSQSPPDVFSTSLSFALQRLEDEGVVRLTSKSDPKQKPMDTQGRKGSIRRRVSHVGYCLNE